MIHLTCSSLDVSSDSRFSQNVINKLSDTCVIINSVNKEHVVFPAVGLSVVAFGVTQLKDELFLVLAKALADNNHVEDTCVRVAAKAAQWLFLEGYASVRPEPQDKYLWLKATLFDATYDRSMFTNHINEHFTN